VFARRRLFGARGLCRDRSATGWLDQLCVHPNCFGAGAAQALIEAARRASPNGIRLDVNADNERARRFYEREGFTPIGAGALSYSASHSGVGMASRSRGAGKIKSDVNFSVFRPDLLDLRPARRVRT